MHQRGRVFPCLPDEGDSHCLVLSIVYLQPAACSLKQTMLPIAIFVSGRGSNLSTLVRAVKKGRLAAEIRLVVCDNPRAPAMARARRAGIEVLLVERDKFSDRQSFEQEIISRLRQCGIKLIVLAGFMRLLSREFVQAFPRRIINIHPSLLPAFKGLQAIRQAWDYGVKVTGVTVHFVDEGVDSGEIILQQAARISEGDSLESLERKIHKAEHRLYPAAIAKVITGIYR